MEIDSKPEALDRLERRIIQLKIEREALKKESDEASRKRLKTLEEQLEQLEKEYADLEEIWKAEKATLQGAAHIKEELERARLELETARRAGDLGRMSELQYGRIPELEKRLAQATAAEQKGTQLLRNKVTDEEIAEVVSKWTGIPVVEDARGREARSSCRWRMRCAAAWSARTRRCASFRTRSAARAPVSPIRAARPARSCSSARPASARPSSPRRSPSSCSTPKRRWCASTCRSSWRSTRWRDSSARRRATSATRRAAISPRQIRRRPYSVILLDEVEKAHPDVFNVLLQVLDDGRLTDGQGRTVDFRNTVIIMTSNLGSQVIQEMAGEANYARMKSAVMEIVQQNFRPEFINRIDDIVVFHPLGEAQIREIVDIQLGYLRQRLLERDMELRAGRQGARSLLAEAGYDPVYGARPLKRAIQQQIENPAGAGDPRGPISGRAMRSS